MADLFEFKYNQILIEWELLVKSINNLDRIIFAIRGWAVSVVTAIIAFAYISKEPRVALYGLAPIVMFWTMDALYKSFQRIFIARHKQIEQYLQSDRCRDDFVEKVMPEFVAPNSLAKFGAKKDEASRISDVITTAFLRNVFMTYSMLAAMCVFSYFVTLIENP